MSMDTMSRRGAHPWPNGAYDQRTSGMSRSEENRERERQEARAQREMNTRVNAAPSPDKKEAMFAVVPLPSNAPSNMTNQIQLILGDFFDFAKQKQTHSVIGVDQQPPTPAPSSHIHDPDTYTLPPPPPLAKSSSSSQYAFHRSHHQNAPNAVNRTKGQGPSPSNPTNKQPSQFPFVEDMKRSHKSGPGPGTVNRAPHQERESSNKPGPHTLNSRGRPGPLNERATKDPQVLKIMSEMYDLKAPVSALLKTPRPDHQSSFTFPAPSSTMHSFRVPMEPSSKGKLPERSNLKSLERCSTEECRLSDESDDESGNVSLQADSLGNACQPASGIPLHSTSNRSPNNILSMIEDNVPSQRPVSPFKTTDESSNSEDSSGSESEESSSSDDGGKKSPTPSSPPQNDPNHWSLTNLFQQGNNVKAESPKHNEVASRNYIEDFRDSDKETGLHLPDHINEPAPPVVTTVPGMRSHRKRLEVRPKAATLNSLTTDDSSDEEASRPTPKVQRTAGGRPSIRSNYNRNKLLLVTKNNRLVDPNLSDDSDDEPVSSSKRSIVQSRQTTIPSVPEKPLKTPLQLSRIEVSIPLNTHSPKKIPKKQELKRKEASKASRERILSDSDNDKAVISSPPVKLFNGRPSPHVSSVRHTRKPSVSPHLALKSPKPLDIGRSPLQDQQPLHRQKSIEASRVPEKHKIPENLNRASLTPRTAEVEAVAPKTLKTEHCKKEERDKYVQIKQDKKRRRKERATEDIVKPVNQPSVSENASDIAVVNSRVETLSSTSPMPQAYISLKSDRLMANVSSSKIQNEKHVRAIICSIPCNLIDKLPNKSNIKSAVEEKVNLEILERRTRGEGGKWGKSANVESPPNEEETKLRENKSRAISAIYKKRPSSLEPDKVKLKAKNVSSEALGTKSPATQKTEDNQGQLKQVAKAEVKDEIKPKIDPTLHQPEPRELKRQGSNSSLALGSTGGTVPSRHSKKHKKDKRKERSISKETVQGFETQNGSVRRKRRSCSESEEVPKNRNSREIPGESFQGTPSHPVKKLKKSPVLTPATSSSPRDSHVSPHPRSSQRSTSEERPHSSLSSDHYPHSNQSYHQCKSKATPLSSQHFTPKGSSMVSPYLGHESEDEAPIGEASSHNHQAFNARDKAVEETPMVNSGNTSEYQSMPSSEHESRVIAGSTYRSIDDRVSPQPTHDRIVAQAHPENYVHVHNSGPNAIEQFSSHALNQEPISGVSSLVYFSTFEKITNPIERDHMLYLRQAKELKHKADRETESRWLQAVVYLEAVLYFILTGESMESSEPPSNYVAALKMYADTLKLIRHVSSPVFRRDLVNADGTTAKLNVILAILSLRCQSLLSLKLYSMKKAEFKDVMRSCNEYIRISLNGCRPMAGQASSTPSSTCAPSTSTGSATPSGIPSSGAWGGSQRSAANNSPSSLSPTPSPAGSVGSEGSQSSSGYSTESTRQQRGGGGPAQALMGQMTPPNLQPNGMHPDLPSVMKCFQVMQNLTQAHEMWVEADNSVFHNDEIKDFFIEIDHRMGPLTFNSSLRDLVPYVNEAIHTLKNLSTPFPAPSL